MNNKGEDTNVRSLKWNREENVATRSRQHEILPKNLANGRYPEGRVRWGTTTTRGRNGKVINFAGRNYYTTRLRDHIY